VGRPAIGTLKVDGKVVATQAMERTIPLLFTIEETFDIGADTGTPIDDNDYQVPFNFAGKLEKLVISVEPPKLTPADIQKLKEAEAGAADAK
jgi:arylsulfatase